jgi:hypothetical protein
MSSCKKNHIKTKVLPSCAYSHSTDSSSALILIPRILLMHLMNICNILTMGDYFLAYEELISKFNIGLACKKNLSLGEDGKLRIKI